MRLWRRQPRRWLTVAAGAALACVAAVRPAASQIDVTLMTAAGDVIDGQLVALSLSGGVLLRAADERRFPLCDLVRITTTTPVSPGERRGFTLTLTNGDVLYGDLVDARDGAVVIATSDLGRLPIPLESITRIDAARAAQPAYQASVEWLDRRRDLDGDHILLNNGRIVRGVVRSIDADGVTIESAPGEGETVLPHRLVVAVRRCGHVRDTRASRTAPAPGQPYLIVTFRASGRLTMLDLDWSDNVVQARLHGGEQVRIKAERIVRLDVAGGRWEWLSQHRPIGYAHTPMLSLEWEYAVDRNVLGGPITVGGETFDHGVGVHSRSSLTYDLKGAYREFVTYFGIDDNSGRYADVSVFILVDGQRRFEKAHVRRGTLFGPVRLDVTAADRIELIVDFGDNGDLQDRFNWVEPALIR